MDCIDLWETQRLGTRLAHLISMPLILLVFISSIAFPCSYRDVSVNAHKATNPGLEDLDISILLGAPGSGKGTHSKIIVRSKEGFVHLSTGDMLRLEVEADTPLGRQVDKVMESGAYVDDPTMIKVVISALVKLPPGTKVLLDGFPRTVKQARALEARLGRKVDRAINFNAQRPILMTRLTGRRVCLACGTSYHIEFMKPKKPGICDHDGTKLTHRKDDKPDVIGKRLDKFDHESGSLYDFYRESQNLVQLETDRPTQEISDELFRLIIGEPPGKL